MLVLPDLQMPFEDRTALAAVIRFVGEFQPDEVVQIGDLARFPRPGRRNKDNRGVCVGSARSAADYVREQFLEPLRHAYSGPVGVIEGNHDAGLRTLADADEFTIERLVDFDGFGVTKLADVHQFAPSWVMTYGYVGGLRVSPIAGNTALNAAKIMGVSVIMGHTRRLGMGSRSVVINGQIIRTLTGVEVGNLMNMKAAGHPTTGAGNWQQGFAVVRVDGTHVQPQIVRISGHRFAVDGVVYHVRS